MKTPPAKRSYAKIPVWIVEDHHEVGDSIKIDFFIHEKCTWCGKECGGIPNGSSLLI